MEVTKKNIIKDKTLLAIAKENNFTTMLQLFTYIKGKRLRSTGKNRSNHQYPAKFTVNNLHPSYFNYGTSNNQIMQISIDKNTTWNPSGFYLDEMALDTVKVSELQLSVDSLEEQKVSLLEQIKICNDLGIEEYDEKLIRTIQAIDTFKQYKSKDKLKEAKDFLKVLEEL